MFLTTIRNLSCDNSQRIKITQKFKFSSKICGSRIRNTSGRMLCRINQLGTASGRRFVSITYLHDFNRASVKYLAAFVEDTVAVIVHQREGCLWTMDSSILPCSHKMATLGSLLGGYPTP